MYVCLSSSESNFIETAAFSPAFSVFSSKIEIDSHNYLDVTRIPARIDNVILLESNEL